ncbi:hypothetical protein CsSME_00052196 [Camellia sinensis var. sinensis]
MAEVGESGSTRRVLRQMESSEGASTDGVKSDKEMSYSSVITNLASEINSCEDVGLESVAGNSEGNAGSNNQGSSQGDSCEADSEVFGGRVIQNGLLEELEVSNISYFFTLHFPVHLLICFVQVGKWTMCTLNNFILCLGDCLFGIVFVFCFVLKNGNLKFSRNAPFYLILSFYF